MAIKIKKDRIEFTANGASTFTLQETGDGFAFDGVIEGTNIFQNGNQGIVAGFVSGGVNTPNAAQSSIQRFPFAVDTNATTLGTLTQARYQISGQSSSVSGYTSGGEGVNTIDKYPFATISNATDVGDLTVARRFSTGCSSLVSGYASGGRLNLTDYNTIDKFPFATDSNASDVGDLLGNWQEGSGISSLSSGYVAGGFTTNTIQKFPFATDTNASDVGDLTRVTYSAAGQNSSAYGYVSGNQSPSTSNTIDRFPFSTDTNASDVGDLTQARGGTTNGQSSTSFGYTAGGYQSPYLGAQLNTIDKFPFSSNSNATDVGDLAAPRNNHAGQQN